MTYWVGDKSEIEIILKENSGQNLYLVLEKEIDILNMMVKTKSKSDDQFKMYAPTVPTWKPIGAAIENII